VFPLAFLLHTNQLTILGLAVLPTCMVIKDYTPIEHGSSDESGEKGRDEEEPSVENFGKDELVIKEASLVK